MTNSNFKTAIKDIFFRSSKIGLLAGGLIRHGLTEKQRQEMETLQQAKVTPIGLTDKQQSDLDDWNKKIEEGGNLTPAQMTKRDDFKSRLTTPKGLTATQQARLDDLEERNSRPPELSDGAKTYIKEVWLENEKGFKEEVTSKHLRKGLQAEEDAISLISFVDKRFYKKNEKKVFKGHLSGSCDVNTLFKDMPTEEEGKTIDARVIDDTKCSWNPRTFMQSALTTGYEWQGHAYLHLYDGDIFRLRHCLVNCPPEVFADEFKKFCYSNGIIDSTDPQYKELLQQFFLNNIYDFDSFRSNSKYYPDEFRSFVDELEPKYNREERVKTFMFERDFELEAVLLKSIELGVEYYQTITLNMQE